MGYDMNIEVYKKKTLEEAMNWQDKHLSTLMDIPAL